MQSDPVDAMAAAVHDVRGSLGSIRLALTSVLDELDDDDVEFRRSMLSAAEAECRRLNASLTALPVLVAVGIDGSVPVQVDLVEMLEAARQEASRRQVSVRVATRGAVAGVARRRCLADALGALCVVVSDGDGDVVVSASSVDGRVQVEIARADGGAVRWDRSVIRALAENIGAELSGETNRLELSFPAT